MYGSEVGEDDFDVRVGRQTNAMDEVPYSEPYSPLGPSLLELGPQPGNEITHSNTI